MFFSSSWFTVQRKCLSEDASPKPAFLEPVWGRYFPHHPPSPPGASIFAVCQAITSINIQAELFHGNLCVLGSSPIHFSAQVLHRTNFNGFYNDFSGCIWRIVYGGRIACLPLTPMESWGHQPVHCSGSYPQWLMRELLPFLCSSRHNASLVQSRGQNKAGRDGTVSSS